ncbi:10109_t:CDS:2 [Dentiscutata heterogama]|uniref:10109_t:CDS:1 n=1 Tax=Dentiscutata heterogama TaxID=1316150 RepID=A0ACA9KZK2_9GLOM|nr:10109_t:CDS:2 [Dentiscutata heterogama]
MTKPEIPSKAKLKDISKTTSRKNSKEKTLMISLKCQKPKLLMTPKHEAWNPQQSKTERHSENYLK